MWRAESEKTYCGTIIKVYHVHKVEVGLVAQRRLPKISWRTGAKTKTIQTGRRDGHLVSVPRVHEPQGFIFTQVYTTQSPRQKNAVKDIEIYKED